MLKIAIFENKLYSETFILDVNINFLIILEIIIDTSIFRKVGEFGAWSKEEREKRRMMDLRT